MNLKKTILALTAVMAVSGICANAYNSYLEGKYVNITSVEFKDENGTISSLPSSGEITVSARAKKGTLADEMVQQVTLVAALYDGDKLTGIKSELFDLTDKYTKEISLSVDVEGATGLRVFVCDNLDNGVPFASKSIFASGKAELKGISVGGVMIEDFNPEQTEYDVTVSAAYKSFPEVTPRLVDSGAKCEIETEGTFPLASHETAKAVITVGSKEYTLNLTQEEPAISNLKVVDSVDADGNEVVDTAAAIIGDIKEVEFSIEPTEPIKISTNSASGEDMTAGYGSSNATGTAMFSDRPYPMMFIPEQLKNAYMVQTKLSFDRPNGSCISFDLNSSATVYASATGGTALPNAGFIQVPDMYISWLSYDSEKGRLYRYNSYAKHFDVKPGETTHVEIPHSVINAYIVFDETSIVSNPIMKNKKGEESALSFVDVKNLTYMDWKMPDYKDGAYTYAAKFIADKADEEYRYSTDFPQELIGSTGIAVPNKPRNYNTDTKNRNFISFDLSETADVYIAYEAELENIPWMSEDGYENVADQLGPITYVADLETTEYTTRIYKKTYNVIPGETVKVELGAFPKVDNDSDCPLMIFVQKHNAQ